MVNCLKFFNSFIFDIVGIRDNISLSPLIPAHLKLSTCHIQIRKELNISTSSTNSAAFSNSYFWLLPSKGRRIGALKIILKAVIFCTLYGKIFIYCVGTGTYPLNTTLRSCGRERGVRYKSGKSTSVTAPFREMSELIFPCLNFM